MSCRIYSNRNHHNPFILHIICRTRQTTLSYRTPAEVKSSITSRSARRTFWRISGGTSLDTCSLSRTFASHLCSFSEGTCHPLTGSLFRLPAFPLSFSFRQLPGFFRFLGFRLLRFFRLLLYFFLFRFRFGLDNNGFFILLGKHLLFYRLLHFRGNGLRHHIHFHQRGISTSKCIGHFTQHYRHTVFILLLRQSEANQYQQENERYMYQQRTYHSYIFAFLLRIHHCHLLFNHLQCTIYPSYIYFPSGGRVASTILNLFSLAIFSTFTISL